MRIHQILPGFAYGDAISNEAIALKRWLRDWGHASQIYARVLHDRVAHEGRPVTEFDPGEADLTIYHYSIGSPELDGLYRAAAGRKLLIYHNITPDRFLAPYHEADARICAQGRQALPGLAAITDVAVGDSAYNRDELAEAGFRQPGVLPLPIDLSAFDEAPPCQAVLRRYRDDWTNFLFVGRVTPNKCPQDAVRLFAHYNRFVDRRSRLFLVGGTAGMPSFLEELHGLIADYGLHDHIVLTGHVHFRELVAYYRLAHLFVCMSEHEGFCVPLLEASHFRLPVLAYAAAAVPETLGDGGVLFTRKEYPLLAEMAHRLVRDEGLRDRITHRQAKRLNDVAPAQVGCLFRAYLNEAIGKHSCPAISG